MAETTLTIRDLNRATLARQLLLAREAISPQRAIERLIGLQAQWPKPPFFGLWTRLRSFVRDDLRRALVDRTVVRASTMRGTIHVLSAPDYLRFRSALQPVLTRGMNSVLRDRLKAMDVERVLADAREHFGLAPRTFTVLRDFLMTRHADGDERALGFVVRTRLPLVQVPTNATWAFPADAEFTLAEAWLGSKLDDASDAQEELVLRYLAAFGPATPGDAQSWSGLQALRATFERLRPKLVSLRDERGRELFDLPKAPRPKASVEAPVRFLPEFDNVLLGHQDRTRIIAEPHRPFVFLPGLRVAPTFLVDGFVAGTWGLERKKKVATIAVTPFAKLSKAVRETIAAEADALVHFAEEDATSFEVRFDAVAKAKS